MMRKIVLVAALLAAFASPSLADELRPPLEKQFFDYFTGQCVNALEVQAKAKGKRLDSGNLADNISAYCKCTSQAVVSYLSAEEIIAFAVNPESEPAASKMKPHFAGCQGKTL
jgi:hypothetical protein